MTLRRCFRPRKKDYERAIDWYLCSQKCFQEWCGKQKAKALEAS